MEDELLGRMAAPELERLVERLLDVLDLNGSDAELGALRRALSEAAVVGARVMAR